MALSLKKKEPKDAGEAQIVRKQKEPKAPKAPKEPKAPKGPKGAKAPKVKGEQKAVKLGKGGGKQFALLIGDEGAILVFMDGNKVVRRLYAPSAQPSSTEAMVGLMKSNPNVSVTILIDAIDQQFVRQSFPPVSSLSVKGLVTRRLDRDFQAEDIKGSLPLGREKEGRKEWNFLLIAIAKTALLTEWLDLISELPNRLMGMYLVPVEAYNYINLIGKAIPGAVKSDWQLLVTHNKVSGFRQVVVHEGKLVFTRVTQAIDDAIPAVIAGNIEQEIINTIEYLRRMNFQDASGIDIAVVASADVNEALDLKRFSMANPTTLSPLDVADAFGLEQAALSADRFGDVVMAAAFLRSKKHTLRFSTAYIDSLAKLYAAKLGVKIVAALASLALLGMSVTSFLAMTENNAAIEQSENKRKESSPKLQELKTAIGGLNKNVAFKSAAVNAHDVFMKDAHSPLDFITKLSGLVTPSERVQAIEWESTSKPGASTTTPKDTPLKIKVDFEFRGTYADIEGLARAETAFIELLKKQMPEYTITHELFPWQKGNDKGMEISFDQKQEIGIKDGDTRLAVTFLGPKKVEPAPGAAAPAAGAAAPGATQ